MVGVDEVSEVMWREWMMRSGMKVEEERDEGLRK